ncbi:hypothetical protein J6590_056057 [Homalodisca vitripennis]|nr:hypothetical protein J6590_056057 [Homalodisca vitripennis]
MTNLYTFIHYLTGTRAPGSGAVEASMASTIQGPLLVLAYKPIDMHVDENHCTQSSKKRDGEPRAEFRPH